jgi:hypothetical protein
VVSHGRSQRRRRNGFAHATTAKATKAAAPEATEATTTAARGIAATLTDGYVLRPDGRLRQRGSLGFALHAPARPSVSFEPIRPAPGAPFIVRWLKAHFCDGHHVF